MTSRKDAVHPNIAADRLGISVDAVYDRIRRGELAAEKSGNCWVVILPSASTCDSSPNNLQEWRSATLDSTERRTERMLTRQVEERDAMVDEIRARLVTLESDSRSAVAPSEIFPVQSARARRDVDPAGKQQLKDRLSDARPRLLALTGILGLILGGIVIQSSSAQRSDDLMVAFVFACGAVTGAIASWLALIR